MEEARGEQINSCSGGGDNDEAIREERRRQAKVASARAFEMLRFCRLHATAAAATAKIDIK